MGDLTFGQKVSWFIYQKGISKVAKPEFLTFVKLGDAEWFTLAETLYKDNNLDGRQIILDQIMNLPALKKHPKRTQFLQMLLRFLAKGILDERRDIVKFFEENATEFTEKGPGMDSLLGALLTAQRDSDQIIANTAEVAYQKMGGQPIDTKPLR